MTSLAHIKTILQQHKPMLFEKYGLSEMAIFGSFGKDSATPESDVDILIDYFKPMGGEFIDLAYELETILNRRVDLVSLKGLKSRYFEAIKNDLTYV